MTKRLGLMPKFTNVTLNEVKGLLFYKRNEILVPPLAGSE